MAQEVVVVRDMGYAESLVIQLLTLALRAWLVMLLLPTFTPWSLSYWQAVAGSYVIGALFAPDSAHLFWTRPKRAKS